MQVGLISKFQNHTPQNHIAQHSQDPDANYPVFTSVAKSQIFVIPATSMSILQSFVTKLSVQLRSLKWYILGYFQRFDRRHRVRDDWFIITYFVTAIIKYAYLVLTNRINYWYTFESIAKGNKNPALIYVGSADSGFATETFSYNDVYIKVLRLSHILYYEHNVRPGDTVGVMMHNKPIFIFYWLALWNLGARPAFLNYNVNSIPLVHCLKVSEVSQVFVDEDTRDAIFLDKLGEKLKSQLLIREQLPHVDLNFVDEGILLKRISDSVAPEFRLPDNQRSVNDKQWSAACYIFTSGTTGLPKAAIMSWRKVGLGASLYGRIVRINRHSTVFTAMPLYHSTAAILGVVPTFTQHGCVAICDKFSALAFWGQAKATKATHIQYVGEICRYLLSRPKNPAYEQDHQVTVAYGNGLRKDIWREFKERFHIYGVGEFFASTESPIATTSFQYGDFGIGACRNYGTFINYILLFQQRLVKMDGEEIYRDPVTGLGRVPDVGEPGELLFRILRPKQPELDFQGYKNDKQGTHKKIAHNVYRKGDCWMRTGDLIKADADGLFYFVDRMGDTYRWKSENVSTNEVEVQFHYSGLLENAIVVGKKIPGYEGAAGYVVLKPKSSIPDFLDKLSEYVVKELPKYAIPTFLRVAQEFDTTDTHKIIKKNYKNEQFPSGANGDAVIYWFNKSRYEKLTDDVWNGILQGTVQI